jgi:hypothetical protein
MINDAKKVERSREKLCNVKKGNAVLDGGKKVRNR